MGDNVNAGIMQCLNIGTLIGIYYNQGFATGIIGSCFEISNCVNAGCLSAPRTGGISGLQSIFSTHSNCVNTGVLLGSSSKSSISAPTTTYPAYASNYYDRQMCPYGGLNGVDVAGQAEGKLTTNATLTGTALQSILGTDDWVYEDSMYPRLKCFDTMWAAPDAYRKAGYVGASPVFLHIEDEANYDKHNSVTHCFKVSMKHGVTWSSANGRVSIDADGNVTLLSLGWDTLTCSIMTQFGIPVKKQVPINIIDTLCSVPSFKVITKPNIVAGGTTTPDTTFALGGDSVVITATAADCYHFVKWTNIAGDSISNKATDTIIVFSDTTLTAVFKKDTFHLQAWIEPSTAGILTGTGFYECGSEAILNIELDDCYHFESWRSAFNFEVISTQNPATILMNNHISIVAFLVQDTFNLSLRVTPAEAGTAYGSGRFACGSQPTITVNSNECWYFTCWTNEAGDTVSENIYETLTLTSDSTLTANFAKYEYTLTLIAEPPEGGIVNGADVWYNQYNCGDTVDIVASPFTDYSFINWTWEDGSEYSTNATEQIVISRDISLFGNFVKNAGDDDTLNLTLTTNPSNAGNTTGSGHYKENDTVTITAIASVCYHFVNWTDSAGNIISTDAITKIIIKTDSNLIANFAKDSFNITLRVNPDNAGTTTGSGKYECGEQISISATGNECFEFICWTNEAGTIVSTNINALITINKDTTLTANFATDPFTLTLIADQPSPNGGSVYGAGEYACGEEVTIRAEADADYIFLYWIEDGVNVSTDDTYTIIMKKHRTLTAKFISNTVILQTLTLTANPANVGITKGSGKYEDSTKVEISATITDDCYHFVNWTDNYGNIISTKIIDTIFIISDTTLTANFAKDTFNLTTTPNPADGGTTTGTGSYACGEEAIITAIPNANYLFVNWTEDNNIISVQEIDTIIMNNHRNLIANFTKKPQEPDTTLEFTIRASENKLIDPRTQNYEIPIYITSNENISDLVIEELKILINVNVFYPKASSNGAFTAQLNGDIFEITLKNIRIANLTANREEILLTIRGDMILGNTDTSGIIIKDIAFDNTLIIKDLRLIDGYITMGICTEGGDRLISMGESPGVFVDENPVNELLKVTCITIERGNYSLEIVDLLGNSTKIKEFVVTQTMQNDFNFEFHIGNLGNGTYIIIMNAPNAKYTNKFVVIKQ
ncbi:MAG: hypothetical protein LBO69_01365 [Ignavibacteria bacterium]|nr:hypothetical protein [Ignavibacteria bacterium]